jgi:CheY-like chemotaxis protein
LRQFLTNTPVLLIEDEPIQRKIVSSQLETSGFSVIEAGDGREGLSLWREVRREFRDPAKD